MSLRDQILGAQDSTMEEVDVSKWWSCSVYVRSLTAKERDELDELRESGLKGRIMTVMVILACCDADGNRLFTMEDEPALQAKNGAAMSKIFTAAMRLNSYSEDKIEDAKKNSSTDPSD